MTFLILLLVLMAAATAVDGWSQHRMLKVNGGKGYETSSIYGPNPTYLRYALINVPALVGAAVFVWYGLAHRLAMPMPYVSGAAFIAWHAYGTYLNWKNF